MNKRHLATANALCGRLETLQGKLNPRGKARTTYDEQRAYEAVARAKNAMLDAIRIMEGIA